MNNILSLNEQYHYYDKFLGDIKKHNPHLIHYMRLRRFINSIFHSLSDRMYLKFAKQEFKLRTIEYGKYWESKYDTKIINYSKKLYHGPQYEHDCENCIFLGRFNEKDLYVCLDDQRRIDTVIARYGNEGYEYVSGLPIKDEIMELSVAYALAKHIGFEDDEFEIKRRNCDDKDNKC